MRIIIYHPPAPRTKIYLVRDRHWLENLNPDNICNCIALLLIFCLQFIIYFVIAHHDSPRYARRSVFFSVLSCTHFSCVRLHRQSSVCTPLSWHFHISSWFLTTDRLYLTLQLIANMWNNNFLNNTQFTWSFIDRILFDVVFL